MSIYALENVSGDLQPLLYCVWSSFTSVIENRLYDLCTTPRLPLAVLLSQRCRVCRGFKQSFSFASYKKVEVEASG